MNIPVILSERKRDKIKKLLGLKKDNPEENQVQVSPLSDLPAKTANIPKQPLRRGEDQKLKKKYSDIEDVGERAFQILVDLNMVKIHD